MITKLLKQIAAIAWLIPGFLLWASFPPMGEKTDVIFALAPMLWLSRRCSIGTSVKRWFGTGLVFWVATLSWMPAIVKNGGPAPLVVLGLLGLAAYCSAFFAAFGWLDATYWQMVRERSYGWRLLGVLVVEPLAWCGLELVRSRFLGGFAWNQLGVVPVNGGFGAPAALGGVYLCSAVIILLNGTFAGIAERVWKPESSGFARLKKFGPFETLLAFALIGGIYALADRLAPVEASSESVKVALVQRNMPCVFLGHEDNPFSVYAKLLENVADLEPDLVLLSESAMGEIGPLDQQGAVRLASAISHQCGGATVLAGGTRYGDGKMYNSAAAYSFATNRPVEIVTYDKVHLVPFGEFIPGDKLFPALQKLAPVGSCTPGELKLMPLRLPRRTEVVPVGMSICFEDTDSAQVRDMASLGARILFDISNDAWFSHSIEPVQHAWQATARAIETGLPLVRVSNSGVTGTVSADGTSTWLLGTKGRPLLDRRGTMLDRIAVAVPLASRRPTVYVVLGDKPLFFAFFLLILAVIMVQYKERYEKRRSLSL